MWASAVLKDIDSLPSPQRQVTIIHWNDQTRVREHTADVRGRIVGSFQIVCIPRISFRHEMLHESLQVGTRGGVPVFTEDERSAGVRQEQKAHALRSEEHTSALQSL